MSKRTAPPSTRGRRREKAKVGGTVEYDTAEEALDAAVGIEERAERFASSQGDKARRLFEEALTVYGRAIQLGGETFADACYNFGRTCLVLATDFYTPSQARPALESAFTCFLSALSTRLSDPGIAKPGSVTAQMLTQISEEVRITSAICGQPVANINLEEVLSRPLSISAYAGGNSADGSEVNIDPFVVDILSSTAAALQALAELDDHYGRLPAPVSHRPAIWQHGLKPESLPLSPFTVMIGSVRFYMLACACFSHAIASSSLRMDVSQASPISGTSDLQMAATSNDSVAGQIEMDDNGMIEDENAPAWSGATEEPTLTGSYDLSTNPLTVSGYAEALTDCFSAVTSLLAIDDDATRIPIQLSQALLNWMASTGRAVLTEADQLQADVGRARTSLGEDEAADTTVILSKLRLGPQILDLSALVAAESSGATGQDGAVFLSEISRLEAVFAESAAHMLANSGGPSDVEVLCDLADSAVQLAQLRIRTNARFQSADVENNLADIRAAWTTASLAAKMLLRAYALTDAADGSSTSGGAAASSSSSSSSSTTTSGVVLGGHEGRAGLLTERQRAQLSISVSLAQLSLLRLHPQFDILRSHQESAEDARRTTDTLRANAVAYSRRALQQAGLKWVYQWADDAKVGFESGGSARRKQLGPDWVLSHAHGVEHEERVLHGGWEILSLRAEALMTAIRAGWYQTLSSSAAAAAAAGEAGLQSVSSFDDLMRLSGAGAELNAMLDCVSALTKRPAQGQQHTSSPKGLESEDIARAFEVEIFSTTEDGGGPAAADDPSGQQRLAVQVRMAVDIDSNDGSVRSLAGGALLGAVTELSFWEWVTTRRNLSSSS